LSRPSRPRAEAPRPPPRDQHHQEPCQPQPPRAPRAPTARRRPAALGSSGELPAGLALPGFALPHVTQLQVAQPFPIPSRVVGTGVGGRRATGRRSHPLGIGPAQPGPIVRAERRLRSDPSRPLGEHHRGGIEAVVQAGEVPRLVLDDRRDVELPRRARAETKPERGGVQRDVGVDDLTGRGRRADDRHRHHLGAKRPLGGSVRKRHLIAVGFPVLAAQQVGRLAGHAHRRGRPPTDVVRRRLPRANPTRRAGDRPPRAKARGDGSGKRRARTALRAEPAVVDAVRHPRGQGQRRPVHRLAGAGVVLAPGMGGLGGQGKRDHGQGEKAGCGFHGVSGSAASDGGTAVQGQSGSTVGSQRRSISRNTGCCKTASAAASGPLGVRNPKGFRGGRAAVPSQR